jgi:hypothetical protein
MMTIKRLGLPAVLSLVAACGSVGVSASPDTTVAPSASPQASAAADVAPVSMSAPSALAAEGIRQCVPRIYTLQVVGIGIVIHGNLVKNYVALSGKEPELMTDDPAFVVQFSGTIREINIGGPGNAGWIDIHDAICVVVDGTPYHYVTGSWVDSKGVIGSSPPGPYDTMDLPPPLP